MQSPLLSPAEVGLGERESVPDTARVLSRYANVISARTFSHDTVETLAEYSDVPVINALSDLEHPCQALADLLTIREHKGALAGVRMAYVGDGNNVARSLCLAASTVGMHFAIATPSGYGLDDATLGKARELADASAAQLLVTEDATEAVSGADVVYTDTWTSMGQEEETEVRRQVFNEYQVNDVLLGRARTGAIFMHCLPAHHGEEVTSEVLNGPASVVFDEAENRLHAQKAVLAQILIPAD